MTTAPPVTPLGRWRRRLEARLRRLDDVLDREPEHSEVWADAWADYLEVGKALATAEAATPAPMITTQELAASLGVSSETVRDMVADGRLTPKAKFGRRGGYRFEKGQQPRAGSP